MSHRGLGRRATCSGGRDRGGGDAHHRHPVRRRRRGRVRRCTRGPGRFRGFTRFPPRRGGDGRCRRFRSHPRGVRGTGGHEASRATRATSCPCGAAGGRAGGARTVRSYRSPRGRGCPAASRTLGAVPRGRPSPCQTARAQAGQGRRGGSRRADRDGTGGRGHPQGPRPAPGRRRWPPGGHADDAARRAHARRAARRADDAARRTGRRRDVDHPAEGRPQGHGTGDGGLRVHRTARHRVPGRGRHAHHGARDAQPRHGRVCPGQPPGRALAGRVLGPAPDPGAQRFAAG